MDDHSSHNWAAWRFDNSYTRLPGHFFVKMKPVPVRTPKMLVFNHALAKELGLSGDALAGTKGAQIFAGNMVPEGADPIAQAYAGHQFGQQNMLGDGRAILLGEHITPDGKRFDVQLKGSGQTPFSRRGDGRAALGPMLREYIISEAMSALGIPTTRSLAVVATGEPVFREKPAPGAILTRVAGSHIRVGTFEYAAGADEGSGLKALADYTIQRHYPDVAGQPEPYCAFLHAVVDRQAALIAKWMHVGFIHGVMNTDNMALSGETIDYGPCAFMDHYSPGTVFSSIDRNGRYAFGNQPRIGAWNLARLAEALLPLLHGDQEQALKLAKEAVETFPFRYEHHWLAGMRGKLGLFTAEAEDEALFASLLSCMERNEADYTNTFRALSGEKLPDSGIFSDGIFQAWHSRWQARLGRQSQPREVVFRLMNASNPNVIPRNYRVEEALAAAVEREELSVMEKLLAALREPFADSPFHEGFREPAAKNDSYQTFCGT